MVEWEDEEEYEDSVTSGVYLEGFRLLPKYLETHNIMSNYFDFPILGEEIQCAICREYFN